MNSFPTPFQHDGAAGILYSEASLLQRSNALWTVQQQLQLTFPILPWLLWARALDYLQPTLYLTAARVELSSPDLARLTQCLADSEILFVSDPLEFGSEAHYLARRLDNYARAAAAALEELEANPGACGPLVYELFSSLLAGNSLVEEVLLVTDPARVSVQALDSRKYALQPGGAAVSERFRRFSRAWRAARYPLGSLDPYKIYPR